MNRRVFLLLFPAAWGFAWPNGVVIQPEDVLSELRAGKSLHILCVTFPFLYKSKHIPHAQFAGPASKPEGLAKLRAAVKDLPKSAPIIIYCGCCPMKKCPNIRPAYEALRDLGFRDVRVLDLPDNFHTDWIAKGYPVSTRP